MKKPVISAIAAIDENRVLGKDNTLIWDIPEDRKYFRDTTTGHTVIMGKKTYEAVARPLPNRINIVLARDKNFKPEGYVVANSVKEALDIALNTEKEEVFIIGGGQIYTAFLPYTDRLYITLIHHKFEGDTFFPDYSEFKKVISKKSSQNEKYTYDFLVLEKE